MPGLKIPHLCAFFSKLKPTTTSASTIRNCSTSFPVK